MHEPVATNLDRSAGCHVLARRRQEPPLRGRSARTKITLGAGTSVTERSAPAPIAKLFVGERAELGAGSPGPVPNRGVVPGASGSRPGNQRIRCVKQTGARLGAPRRLRQELHVALHERRSRSPPIRSPDATASRSDWSPPSRVKRARSRAAAAAGMCRDGLNTAW